MKRVFILIAMLAFAADAFAHGGGLNACGGHRDKKRGGYHVHNMAKHCACHPKASECKEQKNTKKKSE